MCINSLDLNQIAPKDFDRSTSALAYQKQKDEDDFGQTNKLVSLTQQQNLNLLPLTNTTNSSRKSSISEVVYGTPPSNSLLGSRAFVNERDPSFNLDPDFNNGDFRSTSISISTNYKTSSSTMNHDLLKKNPKCFGAKFSGLPGKRKKMSLLFIFLLFLKFIIFLRTISLVFQRRSQFIKKQN